VRDQDRDGIPDRYDRDESGDGIQDRPTWRVFAEYDQPKRQKQTLRRRWTVIKPLIGVVGAALLLGACASQPQTAVAPPPPPPPVQAPSYMVFFDWDRSNLSPQAMATLGQASAAYKTAPTARITDVGHTDTSGPADYNMGLSLRRADSVKGALVQSGIPATAIETSGRGENNLLVPTGDGIREPQNRRVELSGFQGAQVSMTVFQDPRAYCRALTDKWRQYRNSQVDMREAAAIAKCDAGDYQAGIPVLEDALINADIPLPAPGYRWPGRSYSRS
jgi:outer membrane protein OmpA-like peptidoglycan-associated protein